MDISCSESELHILNRVAEAAKDLGMKTYLIGGFVRDKIMGRPTKDADIVCVGDGIELAKKAAQYFYPVPQVSIFKNFGTAQIKIYAHPDAGKSRTRSPELPIAGNSQEPPFEIEFVGARTESYAY